MNGRPLVDFPGRMVSMALVAGVAGAAMAAPADSERLAAARAQLERCAAEALPAEPNGPLQIEYRVDLGAGRTGTFRRAAAGPDSWVDSLTIGSEHASRGVANGRTWQAPADALEVEWWAVTTLLDLGAQLAVAADERVTAVKDRRANGATLREISIERKGPGALRTVFLAADAPLLLGSVNPVDRREYAGWSRVEGAAWLPRRARLLVSSRQVASIELVSAVAVRPAPDALRAPADAADWASCPGSPPVRAVARGNPEYPEEVRQARAEGTVVLVARVGTDGAVRRVRVVLEPEISRRHAAALGAAAAKALTASRYEPPTCDGVPKEVDVVTAVSFALN